jgi:hypothetical protein
MVLSTITTEKDNNESNIAVQTRRLKQTQNQKDEEESIAGKLKNKILKKTSVQKRNKKKDKGDIKTSLVNVSSNKLDNKIIHVPHKIDSMFFKYSKSYNLQSCYEESRESETTNEQDDEVSNTKSNILVQEDEQPTRRQSSRTRKVPARYECYNLKT